MCMYDRIALALLLHSELQVERFLLHLPLMMMVLHSIHLDTRILMMGMLMEWQPSIYHLHRRHYSDLLQRKEIVVITMIFIAVLYLLQIEALILLET